MVAMASGSGGLRTRHTPQPAAMSVASIGVPVSRDSFARHSIDTGIGTRLSVRYVDGLYSRLAGDEQRAQTLAVARFVWELKERPKGMEMITERVERTMRAPGDVGVTTDLIFLPAELNGR